MPRDFEVYLEDIRQAIGKIQSLQNKLPELDRELGAQN